MDEMDKHKQGCRIYSLSIYVYPKTYKHMQRNKKQRKLIMGFMDITK